MQNTSRGACRLSRGLGGAGRGYRDGKWAGAWETATAQEPFSPPSSTQERAREPQNKDSISPASRVTNGGEQTCAFGECF